MKMTRTAFIIFRALGASLSAASVAAAGAVAGASGSADGRKGTHHGTSDGNGALSNGTDSSMRGPSGVGGTPDSVGAATNGNATGNSGGIAPPQAKRPDMRTGENGSAHMK
jgi:hypothetical protein